MPTRLSRSRATGWAALRDMPRCRSSTSVTCSPTGTTGFSDDSGSWKIIAMSRPRRSRIAFSSSAEQVGALEGGLTLDGVAALGQQAHDRQRRDRLAAAGLADQADGLAGAHVEADAVDRDERLLALAGEGDPQVAHRQQGSCPDAVLGGGVAVAVIGAHLLLLGSRASRSDSPIRVKPSATRMMHSAG